MKPAARPLKTSTAALVLAHGIGLIFVSCLSIVPVPQFERMAIEQGGHVCALSQFVFDFSRFGHRYWFLVVAAGIILLAGDALLYAYLCRVGRRFAAGTLNYGILFLECLAVFVLTCALFLPFCVTIQSVEG